jgi:hypothetical protein
MTKTITVSVDEILKCTAATRIRNRAASEGRMGSPLVRDVILA